MTAAVGLLVAGMLALISGAVTSLSILMAIVAVGLSCAWAVVGTLLGRRPVMLRTWPRIGIMVALVVVATLVCVAYMGNSGRFGVLAAVFFVLFNMPGMLVTGILGVSIGSRIARRRQRRAS